MTERIFLDVGDTLKLAHIGNEKVFDEFTIEGFVGEGGSCICYEARNSKGKTGRLKEFYPAELELERDEQNQMCISEEFYMHFGELRDVFIENFNRIDLARNSAEGRELNNVLPFMELLWGEESVYIWSPNDRVGINLSDALKKTPPIFKLPELLRLTITLGNFLRILHVNRLVYSDLKPSNILVTTTFGEEISAENCTVFDTGGIYDLSSSAPCSCRGTAGFAAPELAYGRARNYTDIFSLGAIIYFALIGKNFAHDDYPLLPQIIEKLPMTCELNIKSKRLLVSILQHSLAYFPNQRYEKIGDMVEDARNLLEVLNLPNNSNPLPQTIAVQNLLYKKPFLTLDKNPRRINLAVIGAGTVAQTFIDQALQAAQIPYRSGDGNFSKREICIKAFSQEAAEDCKSYVSSRPGLGDFVAINSSPSAVSLGQVEFLSLPDPEGRLFSLHNDAVNRLLAEKIINSFAGEEIHYVFCALGDDVLTQKIIEIFADKLKCPIVRLDESVPAEIDSKLEQMGWNAHLSWKGKFSGLNMAKVKADYLDPYNRASSVGFALSVKYKLLALGIELGENFLDAAKKFAAIISDEEILREIAMTEHNRWLIEKSVDGWQAPCTNSGEIDYWHCVDRLKETGKPQDKKKRLHHCIVPCGKDRPLSKSDAWWDEEPLENLNQLDDLDRMSVLLHRKLAEEAAQIKQYSLQQYMQFLRYALPKNDEIQTALSKFEFYMKLIWRGDRRHSRNFGDYFDEFSSALPDIREISEQLKILRRNLIVVAEANVRRDYKANDYVLVEHIPFILTFEFPKIAMAFDDARCHESKNSAVFRNVAAATVLNPEALTYLYCFDAQSKMDRLIETFGAVTQYLEAKKIRSKISLIIAVIASEKFSESKLRAALTEKISLTVQTFATAQDVQDFFFKMLAENTGALFDGSTTLFPNSALIQSNFTQAVKASRPYFEFDFMIKGFQNCINCEELSFISDDAHFNVDDIFSFCLSKMSSLDVFANDYQQLWALFESDLAAFVRCSEFLESVNPQTVNSFDLLTNQPTIEAKYFLQPSFVTKAKKILSSLKDSGVIENFSVSVDEYNAVFEIRSVHKNLLTKIFYLLPSADLQIDIQGKTLKIFSHSLKMKSPVPDKEILKILRKLEDNLCIINFQCDDEISFDCASLGIRRLISDPVKLIVAGIYFIALKQNTFDEIACDVNFHLFNEPQNLSFVGTKNFSSTVIQVSHLPSSDKLFKFSALVNRIGLNSQKIFLRLDDSPNENLSICAEQLGIKLVSLKNIGEIFVQ